VEVAEIKQLMVGGCIIAVLACKILLATFTPLTIDLAFVMSYYSTFPSLPSTFFISLIVGFWSILPVDHPILSASWNTDVFQPSVGMYLLVFMMKLPLLLIDLLAGLLLYRIVIKNGLDSRRAGFAFWAWYLNPYVVINEIWGALDMLPTLLILAAFAMLRERHYVRGSLALLASTTLQFFSVLLLPSFPALWRRNRKNILVIFSGLVGATIYLLRVTQFGYDPSLLLSHPYYGEYLIAPLSQPIGMATMALAITYLIILKAWPRDEKAMLDSSLIVLLALFAFMANWFPQFFVLMIPFLVLDVALQRRSISYLLALTTSGLVMNIIAFVSYFTANGRAFFFMPVSGNQLLQLATNNYVNLATSTFSVMVIGQFAQAAFTATCIAYALVLIQKRTGLLSKIVDVMHV